MRSSRVAVSLVALALLAACAPPTDEVAEEAAKETARTAPLLEGMGEHHHEITTAEPLAQRFFDQGLVLAYGFNHAEAARSFREAVRLDPACAMCYWGLALVLGPNINAPMDPVNNAEANEALHRARELAAGADERERAYIEALSARYGEEALEDRSPRDQAYAEAMRELVARYPEDLDAATLFAEALMDTMPWDYWTEDDEPKPETVEVLKTLERVRERDPRHPGANHFYIHAVESVRPELGVEAASNLEAAVPGAGHLVHMPSHIYLRLGRYHEAALANERAIAADDSYATQCRQQGLYPLMYMPHNRHFLWAAAAMEGRSETAIRVAREISAGTDQEEMRQDGLGTLQHFYSLPLYTLARFGRWEEVLEQPEPAGDLVYPRGVWHYVRGMALARTGELEAARGELEKLAAIAEDPVLETVTIWDLNTTANLMRIALEALAGEIAATEGDLEEAIRRLTAAVELEDDLYYDEPPPWHLPVRQTLGAVLLEAKRAGEAEAAYREDLERLPENAWSLFGLRQSLEAQQRTAEAEEIGGRFETAWQYADVQLVTSRF